jgi:hypothetical protein
MLEYQKIRYDLTKKLKKVVKKGDIPKVLSTLEELNKIYNTYRGAC